MGLALRPPPPAHRALALGLPGLPIPRSAGRWPSRDRVVDYLRAYAAYHRLEIRSGVEVSAIDVSDGGWLAKTSDGEHRAERVVVAAGYNNVAFVPDWPGELGRELVHSASYRNGEPFRGRRVLVVGAGNSGPRSPSTSSSTAQRPSRCR